MTRPIKLIITGVVAIAVLITGGTYVYIHFIEDDAPDKFTLTDDTAANTDGSSSSSEGVEGTWTASSGSQAGYRVKEVLFGQDNTAAGRTTAVTSRRRRSSSPIPPTSVRCLPTARSST